MKFQPNKQMMLKAALLVVLAANVSFEPLKKTMSESLASSTSEARPASSDKNTDTRVAKTKTTQAKKNQEKGTGKCTTKASTNGALTKVGESKRQWFCGGKYLETLTYSTEVIKGETHSHLKVRSEKEELDAHVAVCGDLNGENRAALLEEAKKHLETHLCNNEATSDEARDNSEVSRNDEERSDEGRDDNDITDEDIKGYETRVANCEMKKTKLKGNEVEYKEIFGRERITCATKALRNLGRTMQAELGRKPTKEELADRAKEIVTDDVRNDIRELARSKDKEENVEARELADRLGDSMSAFRERYEIRDADWKKTEKAMKGYESLARTSEMTNDYDDKIDTLRERTLRAQTNYDRTHNVAYLEQLNQLKAQGFNLSNEFEYNMLRQDPFFQVESNNWLPTSEVSPFRSSLESVQNEYSLYYNYLMGNGSLSAAQDRNSIVQGLPNTIYNYRNPTVFGSSNYRLNGFNFGLLPTTAPTMTNNFANMNGQMPGQAPGFVPPANRAGGVNQPGPFRY